MPIRINYWDVRRHIVVMVRTLKTAEVSREVMRLAFPDFSPDDFTKIALIFGRHRPDPTPQEQLARFLQEHKLAMTHDEARNLYVFKEAADDAKNS